MQNEQRLLHPSWILRFGRVRSPRSVSNGRGKKVALLENIADADLAVIVRTVGDQIGELNSCANCRPRAYAGESRDFLGRALGIANR